MCKLQKYKTMTDSTSSSDVSTFSDFKETFQSNVYAEVEAFMGIQPWRFEPPGRNEEFVQREDKVEHLHYHCDLNSIE